jgi:hypothetical protein
VTVPWFVAVLVESALWMLSIYGILGSYSVCGGWKRMNFRQRLGWVLLSFGWTSGNLANLHGLEFPLLGHSTYMVSFISFVVGYVLLFVINDDWWNRRKRKISGAKLRVKTYLARGIPAARPLPV